MTIAGKDKLMIYAGAFSVYFSVATEIKYHKKIKKPVTITLILSFINTTLESWGLLAGRHDLVTADFIQEKRPEYSMVEIHTWNNNFCKIVFLVCFFQ